MSGDERKLRCTHQGCPSPQTHDTSVCKYHAQLVLDRKRECEKAACAAAFLSALSSNKSGDGSAPSYYSCLSDTDSTDSASLSATPASTDTSASPPSSSFWSCFAPATATCYATINCDKKKSVVLDSGASVDITPERHRTGQLTDSPEMVQGISDTTHAWPTRVQWHTKIDCVVPHLLQTEAGFEDFKQLYMPKAPAPDQILSFSQLVEAGYVPHFRPHTDIIKHQLEVYSTHVCPSVLEAPCSHPESCTRCAYVGKKCDIASTPLPWQCLPCESEDPCFIAAGSTQKAYTTRPLSPEDETIMQALHDKWCHSSNSKFVQIYRAQNRVGFPTNFLALLNHFRCKVCALCKGARG